MFYWNQTIIIQGPLQVVEVWKVKVSPWLLKYRNMYVGAEEQRHAFLISASYGSERK